MNNWAAVPGLHPGGTDDVDEPPLLLDVDGQRFAVRPREYGRKSYQYTWLNGPNDGYGFGSSGPAVQSVEEHVDSIRTFLAQIDPATGYIGDD